MRVFFVGREDGGQILDRGARPPSCARLRAQKSPEVDQETPHNCVPGWDANRPWHRNRPDLDAQRIVIVKRNGHPEKPGRFLGRLGRDCLLSAKDVGCSGIKVIPPAQGSTETWGSARYQSTSTAEGWLLGRRRRQTRWTATSHQRVDTLPPSRPRRSAAGGSGCDG